jgi:adenylate cyclase
MAPPWLRQWRLGAGLVLFAFVSTHLVNHALGLASLAFMEEGRLWFLRIWRNPVGTIVLYGALVTHGLLALWFLYERRTLRLPPWQAIQITLGLCLPHYWSVTSWEHGWPGSCSTRPTPTRACFSSTGSSVPS